MKKILKYGLIGLLSATALWGTYKNHDRDFPPIYTNKTGTSEGICTGLVARIDNGATFNGLIVSPVIINNGKVNGASIGLTNLNHSYSKFNGVQLGVLANGPIEKEKGYSEFNGAQIVILMNLSSKENNIFQIGIFNELYNDPKKMGDKNRCSLIFNYNLKKDALKEPLDSINYK